MNTVIRGHTLLLLFLGFCIGLGVSLLAKDIYQATETTAPLLQEQTSVVDITPSPAPASPKDAPAPTPVHPTQVPNKTTPNVAPTPAPTLKYTNEAGAEVNKSNLPMLQVVQPNGAISLKIGSVQQISWSTTDDKAVSAIAINITAYNPGCDVGDCATMGDVIAERVVGTNTYEWKVADTSRGFSMPPGKYIISLRGITNYKVKSYQGKTVLGEAQYIATAHSEVFTVVQ